jgi:hypothetical protein
MGMGRRCHGLWPRDFQGLLAPCLLEIDFPFRAAIPVMEVRSICNADHYHSMVAHSLVGLIFIWTSDSSQAHICYLLVGVT